MCIRDSHNDVFITTKEVASGEGQTLRDSNAEVSTDSQQAIIRIVTGGNSQTNHTLDFGLQPFIHCSEKCIPIKTAKVR